VIHTGNENGSQRVIIHAEGVFFSGWGTGDVGDIIHAVGVRVGFHHPRQRRAGGLPIVGDPFELAAYVLKILRADAHAKHFLNRGEEISQRTNRA
jgi:hypothetical protein